MCRSLPALLTLLFVLVLAAPTSAQEDVDPPVFDLGPLAPATSEPADEPVPADPAPETASPVVESDEDYWDRQIWTLPGFWSDPEMYSTTVWPRYTDRQLNDFLIRAKLAKDLKEMGANVDWRKHTFMQMERLARELRIRKDLATLGVALP